MLRKFKISIDGKEYLVEMEEISESSVPAATPITPTTENTRAASDQKDQKQQSQTPSPAATASAANTMPAPMPGTILKVLVNVGDTVSENQPLMILEAMKMENEIVAGMAGTVSAIHVSSGQAVDAGDNLITIA
ncbi:acetyl-CoA carboxylase biotin carboxyl carrier protein subunit [Streptococcus mutans]|uniref:Acetyl-CoA carboxylase biotin carboxyl carrier protein subunit n=1 Tax=Streptococcus mutans TaxID=1309 RepID=A0AAX1K400_STRMG|nr:acetyl-CoA carboxylase biotin carboxyl carrier protein subunit [Streptococcus mutans]AVM71528.1 acetyl-CoA carboxylase biotin carboxyl carrier protein subunit [Streptococcus mutans]EMB53727.1 acetyl-CoA carboxylase biotin carboxyl carrier protein subunit [Streptococcus mutans NLML8]EMB73076.1 acetyl-CoA carboxylase biotin carboxyl carrier protein subunit [Streptococcus mutans 4VF1]EMC31487.1 acetyl-CoA carboxylase biotin carboxyl carrier protein subunit [Streptococcus mutans NLML1]EMC42373.